MRYYRCAFGAGQRIRFAFAHRNPLTVNEHISLFINYLQAEAGAAANTVSAYRRDLGRFDGFLANRGRCAPTDVTADDVLGFLIEERARGLGPASVGRALVAVRCLFPF